MNFVSSAGGSTAGRSNQPRSVADAAELSSARALAAAAGETSGETQQGSSRLPPLAHHRTHWKLPHRHTAAFAQGQTALAGVEQHSGSLDF